ncbi:MAG: choice-of-anchor tandem repeat GloVer-containing protein, partial [Bryocella sp.]
MVRFRLFRVVFMGLVMARDRNGFGPLFGIFKNQERRLLGLSAWVVLWGAIGLCTGLSPTSLRAQTSASLPTPVVFSGVLQASDGNYYSTLANGGAYCSANYKYICGAIYGTTPQGVVTKVFDFGPAQGSNGSYPNALIEGPDGSFYGTTPSGGPDACSCGVFFKVDTSGVFTLLHAFTTADFQQTQPYLSGGALGHLVLGSDGNFYGYSFAQYAGTIFKLTPSGDFSLLASFYGNTSTGGGFIPSGLIETTDGNFYVTVQGYSASMGNYPSSGGFIYRMTPSGTLTVAAEFPGDGSLGYTPNGDLAQGPDGSIYGVTREGGGGSASPTIYKYTPGGTIQTLYTFPATGENGSYLVSGLILGSDGYLYGTSQYGSTTPCYRGCGTAFRISPTGTFSVIHKFAGAADGGSPYGPIIQSNDGTITGTNGGTTAATPGTIYSLNEGAAPPISLSFQLNGESVTAVGSDKPITLNWKVLNAFSNTAQQCYAYQLNRPAGTTDWTGKQTGSLVNGQWTGSATFNAPTAVGTYVYALTCAGLETGLATLSVGGVTITTTALPDATVSKPYSAVVQALGGVTPYTWGYSGAFPAGLTIDSASGYLTGSPTQFGTYSVTIGATDSSSTPQ